MKRIDPYLILLVLFSIFAVGPLLGPGYFWGAHDGRHSVYFLFEFDRAIQDGVFYPRWAPDFTFGYGYPFFNIYAPGPFFVGEALHLIGFDFVAATKIVFGLAIFLSGPAMFGFVKRLTHSSRAAFLSGLAYIYVPYHIADIYVRADLAESVALVFLPLALWGFYESVKNPSRTTIVAGSLAYGAMLFSHNGAILLFTPVLGIWAFFLIVAEIRDRHVGWNARAIGHHFIRLAIGPAAMFFLGLGLVAIFLLPAILELGGVRSDQWFGNYYSYTNHFIYLFQLFSPFWGFGISTPGPKDGMPFQLGVVPLLLALFSLLAIAKDPKGTRRYWLFFCGMTIAVSLLMLAFSSPLWQALSLARFAQFPWRLLILTTVFLGVLAGAVVLLQDDSGKRALDIPTLLLGILLIAGSYPYLNAQMQTEAKEGPVSILGLFKFQQSAGEMTGSTAWVKEIPTWSPMADVYFANKKVKTKAVITDNDPDTLWIGVLPNGMGLHTNGEWFAFDANAENLAITFNMFYYPGWRAYLVKPWTTDIIRELPVKPVGDQGRIQVSVPQGKGQWLLLRFDDTLPRIAGSWISALSVLTALGLMISQVRQMRSKRSSQV